jgi:CRP-like cAMP-binding protein
MLTVDDYVIDLLMRHLVDHDRRPVSFLVYLWLAAEQQRRGDAVTISYQQLAESIGISKSSAQAAAGRLAKRKLLAVNKDGFTAIPSYLVQRPWRAG